MKTQILKFTDEVRTIACNGQLLATGFASGTIEIQKFQSGTLVRVRSWKGYRRGVWGLIFLLDGGLVSGSSDGSAKKWDLETGREVWVRDLDGGGVWALAELPGGCVAVGCDDGTVRVLDLGTGQESLQGGVCRGHDFWVTAVISLGVVGDRAGSFASGSWDNTIRVWASAAEGGTTSQGTPWRVVEVGSPVHCLSLSPCGGMAAAGCKDWSVRLFRIPEWGTVWSLKVHTDWVHSVSFSPDGRFLASASDDRLVKILSPENGAVLKTFDGHNDWIRTVLFSYDGFSVISGSDDKTVRVWRLVEQDDRIASLLSARTPSDLTYQGTDVFKQLFTIIRTKLIG